jgi:hypothetical protein
MATATIGTNVPLTSIVGPSPGAQSSVQGGYTAGVDSLGHLATSVCSISNAICSTVQNAVSNFLTAGLVGSSVNQLTDTTTACTVINNASSEILVGFWFQQSQSGATGTLNIYKNGSCVAGGLVWQSAGTSQASNAGTLPIYMWISSGLGYYYCFSTTNACSGTGSGTGIIEVFTE